MKKKKVKKKRKKKKRYDAAVTWGQSPSVQEKYLKYKNYCFHLTQLKMNMFVEHLCISMNCKLNYSVYNSWTGAWAQFIPGAVKGCSQSRRLQKVLGEDGCWRGVTRGAERCRAPFYNNSSQNYNYISCVFSMADTANRWHNAISISSAYETSSGFKHLF